MDKKYDHIQTEDKIYQMWEENGYLSPEGSYKKQQEFGIPIKEESFSVLMPPPNANAPLHCGHATYTIQDLMARFHRMKGYKTLYVPGTDHAGFETQVVYERALKKAGKSRFDFDRETFYNDVLSFVEKNSDIAINQMKKLGIGADWSRTTFMLDAHVIDTVYNTFQKMHEDGLIYRDYYMVNYSVHHGTTFSNLETTHVEQVSPLYFVNYKVKDSDEKLTVATVRPETIYADVALAFHPDDSRYQKFLGKTAVNPLTGASMKIISDSYVDPEFGTGVLKVTPGHDFNDFEIGKRHGLEFISLITLEGKMNSNAPDVEGLSVKKAREKTIEILSEKGALEKVQQDYKNNLLVDYKDERPIEPMLLPNWFVKMQPLADKAIEALESDNVKFNLKTWKKQSLDWLYNIKDWPISRQIVFGIRIPVWYSVEQNPQLYVVFLDKEGSSQEGRVADLAESFSLEEIKAGLQKVIAPSDSVYVVSKASPGEGYLQETDTFDTWFSSGQWPLTTLQYPQGEDFKEYFPTTFMDSMWDILFFWIVRMIMLSLYLTDQIPFENVYIHGRVNDEKGRKMSKSLGNVIDPLDFVNKYGADALRMGILVGGNTAAKQTSLSDEKVKGYRNFGNKLWNMARFMLLMTEKYEQDSGISVPVYDMAIEQRLKDDDKVIIAKLKETIKETTKFIESYRFKEAGETLYQFMWDDVASTYIEIVKDREDKDVALSVLNMVYANGLKMLHPYMPFITEEIWSKIKSPNEGPLIVSAWPRG